MSNGRSKAYNNGYYTGFNDTCEDNPYLDGSEDAAQWEQGYDDGMYHSDGEEL